MFANFLEKGWWNRHSCLLIRKYKGRHVEHVLDLFFKYPQSFLCFNSIGTLPSQQLDSFIHPLCKFNFQDVI